MRNHWTKLITLILVATLPVTACLDDEPTGPEDGTATLSIFLTDAQGEADQVWVQLTALTAQGGPGGPVNLLDEPTDLVLLTDLVGTVQLLQVNTGFDPTTISQLRLVIGDAVLTDTAGTVYAKGSPDLLALGLKEEADGELQCPSCSQSGIKVKVPSDGMEVEEGAVAMVLDFDVAQSFGHKAGNSGKWIMHPVIHGTLVGDEDGDGDVLDDLGLANSISGRISENGVALPTCATAGPRSVADFIPTATAVGVLDEEGNPLVWSGAVASDSTFLIGFLPKGTYTMGYLSAITFDQEQLTFVANVSPGEVKMEGSDVEGVTYTITESSCQ
jgi:hypothetical protein